MPLPPIRYESSKFQKDLNDLIRWVVALVAPGGGGVPSTRTIGAGAGLTGGGDLSADRVIDMGTPSTLTAATTNATTSSSHTHEVTGFAVPGDLHPQVTGGADIDVSVGAVVQRKGTGILLFSASGTLLAEYDADGTGLAAAAAAAAVGDVIELPVGVITGNVILEDWTTLRGLSYAASFIGGEVTLGVGSVLENLTIQNTGDSAGALMGIISPIDGPGPCILKNIKVQCENNTGPAYAIYMAAGGDIYAYETELLAQTGTNGYAAYVSSGTFNHYSGRAVGTVATYPYYI